MSRTIESITSPLREAGARFHTFTEEEIQQRIEGGVWTQEDAGYAREHNRFHELYYTHIAKPRIVKERFDDFGRTRYVVQSADNHQYAAHLSALMELTEQGLPTEDQHHQP